jgi:hypothetical protein
MLVRTSVTYRKEPSVCFLNISTNPISYKRNSVEISSEEMSDLKIDILGINFNSCRRGSRGTVLQAT